MCEGPGLAVRWSTSTVNTAGGGFEGIFVLPPALSHVHVISGPSLYIVTVVA